jgi:branched-chain amino acid transport system substrate-binding protein
MIRAHAVKSIAAAATLAVVAACGGGQERRTPAAAHPVSASVCGPIAFAGHGRPQLLVLNSGSLQGPFSDHGLQNAQAAKLVLAKRGWRAGRFTVGLQVCDEADPASSQPSEIKCAGNARHFAAASSVVAVVGPTTSTCAHAMIPVLHRARGGPVPVVSMSATYLGLTRKGPGVASGDPERLYPAGARNFARIVPADDAQAAAGALYASGLGVRRPYVLHHDQAWGIGVAGAFRSAAQQLGMTIAGSGPWDRRAPGYARLAERIARANADAVYLAGYAVDNGARLLGDLRHRLGSRVLIVGPDGFNMPQRLVEETGEGAEGLVTTLESLPARALPPNGRRFAREFEQRFGALPCCYAMQTAQAMSVVLDAIAKSDGSRASVLRNVFRTRVRDGLIGDIAVDRYGDSTLRQVGVYRIQDARSRYVTAIAPSGELLARR